MARDFTARPAVRRQVPLLLGLMGPPGGGKTFSALRLAEGMRRLGGGKPVVIDTEGGRALKYADRFDFLHVPFGQPFKPTDYLDAIRQQLAAKPCAIIVDSMSDEHEGEGGVLDWHEAELDRMAGQDYAKRERMTQAAWIKPKADRRMLLGGLNTILTPIIFCFRAREKTKQLPNDRGKMVPTNIGYSPIAPTEIVHTLDLACLLPARAEGVPVWHSDKVGEDFVIKLPGYLKPFITEGRPLDESMGEAFARWAAGGLAEGGSEGGSADPLRPAQAAARGGTAAFRAWWADQPGEVRAVLKSELPGLKVISDQADASTRARDEALAAPDEQPAQPSTDEQDELDVAEYEGRRARKQGKTVMACPAKYAPGSALHGAWLTGFNSKEGTSA